MDKAKLIILLFSCATASAEPIPCIGQPEGFRIFQVNGITTNPQKAKQNIHELSKIIGPTFNGQNIKYDLSYNNTSGVITDLLQAATQIGLQFSSQVMLWMAGAAGIPSWLQDILSKAMQGFYPVAANELQDHVAKYRDALLQGNKVLIVSHSQGNLYANEAYEMLRSQNPELPVAQSVGIYGVATPANNVAGTTSPYLTNNRDFISATPGALPENLTLKYASGEAVPAFGLGAFTLIQAHSFTDTYLSPTYNTRLSILDGIQARLASLQKPAASSGDGPITATLSWPGNVDLDLALYEPDGYFVSSRAGSAPGGTAFSPPAGHVGYISLDAESGPGIERYRSNCNQLQVGTYYLGAHYAMDLAYAHPPSEPWCALLMANSQSSDYSELTKSYCGLGEDPMSLAPASALLNIQTPTESQSFSVSWSPASAEIWYFMRPESFVLAARLDVQEITENSDPNQNGQLRYVITPVNGTLPLPSAWQAILAMAP